MSQKEEILADVRAEFDRWDRLLAGMSAEQVTAPLPPSRWSTKDVVAHLWAWQQRSIARLEAAVQGGEPQLPDWPGELDIDVEGEPHGLNAWLYEAYRDRDWASVHDTWRQGFLRALALAEAIPEGDLLAASRFPWLGRYRLLAVLTGTEEHHREHREWLESRLGGHNPE